MAMAFCDWQRVGTRTRNDGPQDISAMSHGADESVPHLGSFSKKLVSNTLFNFLGAAGALS